MGRDKAFVEVAGTTMVQCVISALETGGCDPIVLVGGDGARLAAVTGRPWIADTWPGEGPLGGVIDALRWTSERGHDRVVVAACDLPGLDGAAVTAVAARRHGSAVAAVDGRQPSLACWSTTAADHLTSIFTAGERALGRALEAIGAVEVPVHAAALHNANHPADLGISLSIVSISEIDVDELAERLAHGATVIDVRQPDEYAAGHVPGAVLVPLATVGDELSRFRADGPTYVICQAGARSMRACELAAGEGFDVVNIAGGTGAWVAAGFDVDTEDSPP